MRDSLKIPTHNLPSHPLLDSEGTDGKPQVATVVEGTGGTESRSASPDAFAPARDAETLSTEEAIMRDLPDWRGGFVVALYDLGGNLTLACRRCGVSRSTIYEHCQSDPVFAGWVKSARSVADDLVEGALMASATVGDLEPVFQRGVHVGFNRRKSVRAAQRVLAAHRPEYRQPRRKAMTSNHTQANTAVSVATTPEEIKRLADAAAARLFCGESVTVDGDEVPEL